MLSSVETGEGGTLDTRLGKEAVAQSAETVMLRICKVMGGEATPAAHPSAIGSKRGGPWDS